MVLFVCVIVCFVAWFELVVHAHVLCITNVPIFGVHGIVENLEVILFFFYFQHLDRKQCNEVEFNYT